MKHRIKLASFCFVLTASALAASAPGPIETSTTPTRLDQAELAQARGSDDGWTICLPLILTRFKPVCVVIGAE